MLLGSAQRYLFWFFLIKKSSQLIDLFFSQSYLPEARTPALRRRSHARGPIFKAPFALFQ